LVEIPVESLEDLYRQLLVIHRLYGDVISGKEAKKLHFISPILNCVCSLLPDISITVEEDMRGVNIFANGRFEYIIHYRNKKVCIIEAKKDDMEQGQVQSLLGCEVVAETEKCSEVYAVVTNYIQWLLFKCTDDFVYHDILTLSVDHDITKKKLVGQIANYIYGILIEIRDNNIE
jgi:hypothetical protein